MQRNDLLTLLDREAESLAAENNHSAAALMRAAAEEIRGPATITVPRPLSAEAVKCILASALETNRRLS